MKQCDDYISGAHHYWLHFVCGLLFGAAIGSWIGWQLFDGAWGLGVTATLGSLAAAFSCGRWGDRAWHWMIERLPWVT